MLQAGDAGLAPVLQAGDAGLAPVLQVFHEVSIKTVFLHDFNDLK